MEASDQTQAILHAATEVFAEKGFEGARIEEIAERAGVNKAGLYYHLGNKADIYAAVFHELMANTISSVEQRVAHEHSPEDKLRAYANELAVNVDSYKFVAPMMMREILSGAKNIPDQCLASMMQLMYLLKAILEEGQAQDLFDEVNPILIHMLIINTLLFHISGEELRQRLKATAVDQETFNPIENSAEMANEVTALVLNAIRKT